VLEALKQGVATLGKPAWRPMLAYVANLHEASIRPPTPPLPHPWEEIGPGYCYGPAFGHWDIIHQVLDVLPTETDHARSQLLNDFACQRDDGMLQGCMYLRQDGMHCGEFTHPPVWPVAVEAYCDRTRDTALLRRALDVATRQLEWFARNRAAEPSGYLYCDILTRHWESGVDEGVRFDDVPPGRGACVDATSHVLLLAEHAARWAGRLGGNPAPCARAAELLRQSIRDAMFDPETGFFHDAWAVGRPEHRRMALEGMWPVVVGAATDDQAARAIDENLLNERRFFTAHPPATVAVSDPKFELRMWRGPAWNSMTYWAALGCMRYGRLDAAAALLERALDRSAEQFDRTGTIWEFHHPHGGEPTDCRRKPDREHNQPCRDYLGHNPLIAMARLWEQAKEEAHA
jgi:glycogen debranching enzyme